MTINITYTDEGQEALERYRSGETLENIPRDLLGSSLGIATVSEEFAKKDLRRIIKKYVAQNLFGTEQVETIEVDEDNAEKDFTKQDLVLLHETLYQLTGENWEQGLKIESLEHHVSRLKDASRWTRFKQLILGT